MDNNKIEIKISYYPNGKIKNKVYLLGDYYHRLDGPAFTSCYSSGKIGRECYYLDGKLHREDGPAVTWYHENSEIEREYYYLNDNILEGEKLVEFKHSIEFNKEIREIISE
jgi:antitoxin component YwqK of YwqJK toxin-antitoxin module